MKGGVDGPPVRRLVNFTPLRYPGGKAKLARFVKDIIELNRLGDGHYVEPYAGGAGIALELLFHEYVSTVHINDISRPIHAFWRCVLDQTDELVRKVRTAKLTVATWDRNKKILSNPADHDDLDLGFAAFYLNRTNRSGILNGGIIGGRDQTGPWKIDARFNAPELARRIEEIAKFRNRIRLSKKDALTFLRRGTEMWPENTLIYLDPPYYVKGRDLYPNFYTHDDHVEVATFVCEHVGQQKWIVSYDDVPAIRQLYEDCKYIHYQLDYSARAARKGSELMYFCDALQIPPLSGPMSACA